MQPDAQSIIEVIGETLAEERSHRRALELRFDELARPSDAIPDDVAEQVAKAIVLLNETAAPATPSIVLNINSAATRTSKTITTHRDESGNLVAEIVEQ